MPGSKTYSTREAAEKVAISWVTLRRWLAASRVRPSVGIKLNGKTLWRWTTNDVRKLSVYKAAHYCKGRGRKKKLNA